MVFPLVRADVVSGGPLTTKLVGIVLALAICLSGYAMTSAGGATTPVYDLVIDDIPVNFTDDKTLRLDTQTNDRGFVVWSSYLQIRSPYITLYELNDSYEHDDINLVIGDYCYAYVPARNATLDTIIGIDHIRLSSWNGTVTVEPTSYSWSRTVLKVNSTDDASLIISGTRLNLGAKYNVLVDNVLRSTYIIGADGGFTYNYSDDWSTHNITIQYAGSLVVVPSAWLNMVYVFLTLGLFVTVTKTMILPIRQKNLNPQQVQRHLIKAAIVIVVGMSLIVGMTEMFIGG